MHLMILIVCFFSFREGLDLVKEAISRTVYNDRLKIAIDVAATDFCIGDLCLHLLP